MGHILPLDFATLNFSGEIRKDYGEDSWCYGFTRHAGMIAVFDGCGGSGSRQHSIYNNHTEAYMASRLCSGTVYESMHSCFYSNITAETFTKQVLEKALSIRIGSNALSPESFKVKLKGLRTLPTTMASVLIQCAETDELLISPIWAGDSRAYFLDATGLSQISIDDSTQKNPLESVTGVITNIISGDAPINLNYRVYRVKPPFMVLVVTDGCYESVATPMELEGMILHTMLESSNVAQWEENLRNLIGDYAHDDHTLCLASFGYENFDNIQRIFSKRYETLRKDFLEPLWAASQETYESRRYLCEKYRPNYMKFIEGDDGKWT